MLKSTYLWNDLRRASILVLIFLLFMIVYFLVPHIMLSFEISRRKQFYKVEYQKEIQGLLSSSQLHNTDIMRNFRYLALIQSEASVNTSGVLPTNFSGVFKPVAILIPSLLSMVIKVSMENNKALDVFRNIVHGISTVFGF